tara:strand:+ start:1365 stop:2414 length:1050 start_codon:yes stop_codon:yes gene_type:complete
MAETAYDPYAYSDIGSRALGGEKIYNRNFYWFDPVTQKSGMTTEGWSRVPDWARPYTYIDPSARNAAETKFYQSGGTGIGVGGGDGKSNNLLSGLDFARSIAGGEAAASMIAPGVSYSQERPGGYTQDDLNYESGFFNEGRAPVLNLGTGQGAYDPIPNQMPYAPPGTTIEKFVQPETRPQTVSPLGSLDTTYLSDIDFRGLLNDIDLSGLSGLPSPQVDFPIATPEVVESAVANQPIYQDPILDMVEPVANNEIIATDIIPEPSYPSLGASLFDNVNIIPEAPEPMPLVNASVATPESSVDINALQNLVNNIGLLNEPMAVPQNNTPSVPLNIFDAPINFDAIRTYGR